MRYSLTWGLVLLVGAPKQQVAAFYVEDGTSPVGYGAVHPPPTLDYPTPPDPHPTRLTDRFATEWDLTHTTMYGDELRMAHYAESRGVDLLQAQAALKSDDASSPTLHFSPPVLLGGAVQATLSNGSAVTYHSNESKVDHFHALDENTIIGQCTSDRDLTCVVAVSLTPPARGQMATLGITMGTCRFCSRGTRARRGRRQQPCRATGPLRTTRASSNASTAIRSC